MPHKIIAYCRQCQTNQKPKQLRRQRERLTEPCPFIPINLESLGVSSNNFLCKIPKE